MVMKIVFIIFLLVAEVSFSEIVLTTKDILEYSTNRPDAKISFYKHNNLPSYSTITREHAPVSIRSVKRQLTLLNGNPKTLNMLTKNKQTIFGFEAENNQMHFFSTDGGYLLITKDQTNKTSVKEWLQRLNIAKK